MAVGDFFLTAFDPSDLPGTSIDPLGFERGYLFLADKVLPGLTNVANRPRYFAMLCAGVALADVDDTASQRTLYNDRRQAVLRLERLWALANVLAANETRPASGIRGIRYVSEEVARLQRQGGKSASSQFKLLSRQEPYGVLGIYGAIAEGLRFIVERKTFALSPDAGDALAEAFIAETEMPSAIKKAVRDDLEINMSALTAWGERAHISASPGKVEARVLDEALHRNPLRSRMAKRLTQTPPRENEPELARIKRIVKAIPDAGADADIKDALEAIVAFEESYQMTLLGFERLLWLCRRASNAVVMPAGLQSDEVIRVVCEKLPPSVARLGSAFQQRRTDHLIGGADRIDDVHRFLERAVVACDKPVALCHELLARHADVQHGKFDRGRRKMPWIESTSAGLALTSTRAGGLNHEVASPDAILPHAYRLGAADALVQAAAAA